MSWGQGEDRVEEGRAGRSKYWFWKGPNVWPTYLSNLIFDILKKIKNQIFNGMMLLRGQGPVLQLLFFF